jgi:hypothetical protein
MDRLFINQVKEAVPHISVQFPKNLALFQSRAPVSRPQVYHPQIEMCLSQPRLNADRLFVRFDSILVSPNLEILGQEEIITP